MNEEQKKDHNLIIGNLMTEIGIPLCDGNHPRMGCERERAFQIVYLAEKQATERAIEDVLDILKYIPGRRECEQKIAELSSQKEREE